MRSSLVFPPIASPTYVPFGLALLKTQFYRQLDHTSDLIRVDANLEFWKLLSSQLTGGDLLLDFLRQPSPQFYQPETYQRYSRIWDKIRHQAGVLLQHAKGFLEKGAPNESLDHILERTACKVLENDPELIGISVLFLDQLVFALALGRYLKDRDRQKTRRLILGGAAMSALRPEELLQACDVIDGIVIGEGENAVLALQAGHSFEAVPGLLWRSPTGLRCNRQLTKEATAPLGSADFSGFPLAEYFNPEPVLPVSFSRDCQWRKCRFCAHLFSFSGCRKKSVSTFVDELTELQQRWGAHHFYFTDQYIAAEDLDAIATTILKRNLHLAYHVMCRPVAEYSADKLERIARSGCRWISWGVESGSQRLLDLVRKGTHIGDIERVIRDAAEVGISNLAMMILGLPTSSEIDFRQTLSLLERLQSSLDVIRASTFVLYDRTYFARHALRYGLTIKGSRKLLTINGQAIHNNKIIYTETASDGSQRPPCSSVELAAWERHRSWMKDMSFYENLPCEHYLLYCQYRHQNQPQTDRPSYAMPA
jgi:anaerobic magnesium-protoporphyrin IX monomethyl ester cyclase